MSCSARPGGSSATRCHLHGHQGKQKVFIVKARPIDHFSPISNGLHCSGFHQVEDPTSDAVGEFDYAMLLTATFQRMRMKFLGVVHVQRVRNAAYRIVNLDLLVCKPSGFGQHGVPDRQTNSRRRRGFQ